MDREIVKIKANTKAEAIAGLEMVLDIIKKSSYDDVVEERVLVTNEGSNQEADFKK